MTCLFILFVTGCHVASVASVSMRPSDPFVGAKYFQTINILEVLRFEKCQNLRKVDPGKDVSHLMSTCPPTKQRLQTYNGKNLAKIYLQGKEPFSGHLQPAIQGLSDRVFPCFSHVKSCLSRLCFRILCLILAVHCLGIFLD